MDEADPQAAKKARRSADTFDALADRYIEDYAKPHKATWAEDARQIRTMCLPRWKGRVAAEITRADVRELLRDVAKKRGAVTANRLRALLSKLFRWAVSQDYLAANPASELPKLTGRERVLTDDEIPAAAYHAMQAQALTTTRDVTARRMYLARARQHAEISALSDVNARRKQTADMRRERLRRIEQEMTRPSVADMHGGVSSSLSHRQDQPKDHRPARSPQLSRTYRFGTHALRVSRVAPAILGNTHGG